MKHPETKRIEEELIKFLKAETIMISLTEELYIEGITNLFNKAIKQTKRENNRMWRERFDKKVAVKIQTADGRWIKAIKKSFGKKGLQNVLDNLLSKE
jgi:hypothetical protein